MLMKDTEIQIRINALKEKLKQDYKELRWVTKRINKNAIKELKHAVEQW